MILGPFLRVPHRTDGRQHFNFAWEAFVPKETYTTKRGFFKFFLEKIAAIFSVKSGMFHYVAPETGLPSNISISGWQTLKEDSLSTGRFLQQRKDTCKF